MESAKYVVVGIAVAATVLGLLLPHYWAWQREKALRPVAARIGFEFDPAGWIGSWGNPSPFYLFQQGRNGEALNVLSGRERGFHVLFFDYKYTTGWWKWEKSCWQTVVGVIGGGLNLPEFALRPKGFSRRVATWFGSQDIDFPSDPKFSGDYLVRGESEEAVRELLTPGVLGYFRTATGWNVEGYFDRILVYVASSWLSPEEFSGRMEKALEIADLLKDAQPH